MRDRISTKIKPRKILLSDFTGFSRKFAPPKITRYTTERDNSHQCLFSKSAAKIGACIHVVLMSGYLAVMKDTCHQSTEAIKAAYQRDMAATPGTP